MATADPGGLPPGGSLARKVIPLALVIDPTPAGEPVIASYCSAVIAYALSLLRGSYTSRPDHAAPSLRSALQALHPNNQVRPPFFAPACRCDDEDWLERLRTGIPATSK